MKGDYEKKNTTSKIIFTHSTIYIEIAYLQFRFILTDLSTGTVTLLLLALHVRTINKSDRISLVIVSSFLTTPSGIVSNVSSKSVDPLHHVTAGGGVPAN